MRAYLSARRRLLRGVVGADAAEPGRGVPATGRGSSAAAVDAVAAMARADGRARRASSGAVERSLVTGHAQAQIRWLRAEGNWNRDGIGIGVVVGKAGGAVPWAPPTERGVWRACPGRRGGPATTRTCRAQGGPVLQCPLH